MKGKMCKRLQRREGGQGNGAEGAGVRGGSRGRLDQEVTLVRAGMLPGKGPMGEVREGIEQNVPEC